MHARPIALWLYLLYDYDYGHDYDYDYGHDYPYDYHLLHEVRRHARSAAVARARRRGARGGRALSYP